MLIKLRKYSPRQKKGKKKQDLRQILHLIKLNETEFTQKVNGFAFDPCIFLNNLKPVFLCPSNTISFVLLFWLGVGAKVFFLSEERRENFNPASTAQTLIGCLFSGVGLRPTIIDWVPTAQTKLLDRVAPMKFVLLVSYCRSKTDTRRILYSCLTHLMKVKDVCYF